MCPGHLDIISLLNNIEKSLVQNSISRYNKIGDIPTLYFI